MQTTRRGFLKYCIASAASLGLEYSVVGKLEAALALDGRGLPTVIWLTGASCTGCTVSLANRINSAAPVDIADLLINNINLAFHINLMGAAGDSAVQNLREAAAGPYILAVEGAIPTALGGNACVVWTENGRDVTGQEAVSSLAANAAAILCIGTCASYGGVAAAAPNPTMARSVSSLTGRATVNIPGCPTHPDWIVWTIAQFLAGVAPQLDSNGRPVQFFSRSVHDRCPRRGTEEVDTFGVEGYCLKEVGCRGPETRADCPTRLWNNGTNWCVGANAVCIGCTESAFPDRFTPFFRQGEDDIWRPTAAPTATRTLTPGPTRTATSAPTRTPTPVPTRTATPRPTLTPTPRPTATATPRWTATATPTRTAAATPTRTPRRRRKTSLRTTRRRARQET